MWMRHLIICMSMTVTSIAWASSPEDGADPILDPVNDGAGRQKRHMPPSASGSGFSIGGQLGLYGGSTTSVRTDSQTKLSSGWHPSFGLNLGYRAHGVIELNLSADIGLGKAYDQENPDGTNTIDWLLAPSLLIHWFERWPVSSYAGIGGLLGRLGGHGDSDAQTIVGRIACSVLRGVLTFIAPYSSKLEVHWHTIAMP